MISNTNIISCIFNGIFSYKSSNLTISNCNIKNNGKHGIHFNNTCNDNILSNNNISNNDKNGIYLNDYCNRNTINQNDIFNNCEDATGYLTYAGIRIENSSSCTIGNNIVKNNYFYGLMIVGENNTIHNSSIINNQRHGIFLFGDNNNNIHDNVIQNNEYSGIRAFNSTNNHITRNEISLNKNGTYLNYYTISNTIFNNYFHDNSINNAIDISTNKNNWDNTIIGNYWDDFDEISDNSDAVDTDRDGIIDNSYSIVISTYDSFPLSDIIKPKISNVQTTNTSLTQGESQLISATVTDDTTEYFTQTTELKDVRIIITDPNNNQENFSIFQNKTGNTYYSDNIYSTIGNYSFLIAAKDPMNWNYSDYYYFNITEGEAPEITDNSLTTGEAGGIFIVNATVTDDTDDNLVVKVDYSHGINSDFVRMGKNGNYYEYSIQLDNSLSQLSYSIYATDCWGTSANTSIKHVEITDITSPEITIINFEYESDGFIHTYEIETEITDNHAVNSSYIEYWINNGTHNIAEMDKNENSYDKTIYLENSDDIVKCIINATDYSSNTVDTKEPYSDTGGPYNGVVLSPITFNGSDSFDLDGDIQNYLWDFGDGNQANGQIVDHSYVAKGVYTISLTVTDNDGYTNIENSTSTIVLTEKNYASQDTLTQVENQYNLTLSEAFYCYDSDGNDIADYFYDPNKKIETVHSNPINISGKTHFILKPKNQDKIFLWNVEDDLLIDVDNSVNILNPVTDSTDNFVYFNFSINKTTGWIYLTVDDDYKDFSFIVITNNKYLASDRYWRIGNKIYILDDPYTNYSIKYNKTISYGVLEWMIFSPINENNSINNPVNISLENPTITIEYNVPVTITYAQFYDWDLKFDKNILDELQSTDNKKYIYTPENLNPGKYDLIIHAKDSEGIVWENVSYFQYYYSQSSSGTGIDIISFLPYLGLIIGLFTAIFIIIKKKNISFESFIYFKNKKIIPFFKPLVFGPLRLNFDEKNIQKAEIYVNGALKDTLTEPPYNWDFDKRGFMKTRIETKVFTNDGNENSTGEMTFYIFNNRFLR